MSAVVVKHLEKMTEEELDAAVTLHVRNFHGDHTIKAILGGDWSIQDYYWRALYGAALLEGLVYAIDDDKGNHVSFGLWAPPGIEFWKSDASKEQGLNKLWKKLSPDTRLWWTETMNPRFSAIRDPCWKEGEVARRWWCPAIVTDLPYRGQGYASAIVNKVMKDAKKRIANPTLGLAATTDQNTAIYKAMGFEDRGSGKVPAPTGDFTFHILMKVET